MLTEPTVLPAMMVRSVGRHGDGGTVVVGVTMVVVVVGGGRRAIVDCCFCALSLSKLRVLLSSLSLSPSLSALSRPIDA